jgi:hypothetical protein
MTRLLVTLAVLALLLSDRLSVKCFGKDYAARAPEFDLGSIGQTVQ